MIIKRVSSLLAYVVSVQMCDEDAADSSSLHAALHQLRLRTLAAVEHPVNAIWWRTRELLKGKYYCK